MIEPNTELAQERKWLERLALGMVQDTDLASDVVQETYLAALQSASCGSPRKPWLKRIATNVVRMDYRSSKRRQRREEVTESLASKEAEDSLKTLYQKQCAESLSEAINTLSSLEQEALHLRFSEGLSIAQVANQQGAALGTADSRIRNSCIKLRKKLDDKHEGNARPWLIALCPTFDISVPQVAPATATGALSMTKIALYLLTGLFTIGLTVFTFHYSSGEESTDLVPNSSQNGKKVVEQSQTSTSKLISYAPTSRRKETPNKSKQQKETPNKSKQQVLKPTQTASEIPLPITSFLVTDLVGNQSELLITQLMYQP